jgi:hypothetical protein
MNTQPIHGLQKTLRALSVFFISLSVLSVAIPLSCVLGVHTVQGVHGGDLGWLDWIRGAIILILIGAFLFCGYLFSQREKRGLLTSGILWSVVSIAGAFAVFILFAMVGVIIQH